MRLLYAVGEESRWLQRPIGRANENLIAKLPDGTLKIPDNAFWLNPVPNAEGDFWQLFLTFHDGTSLPAGTEVWLLD